MLQKVVIEKLRPNPFRRLDEYPIRREKVDALKKSIDTTGFWGTIVGRPVEKGFIEIAFGHHRLVALQESLSPKQSVEIIVRDLSNEDMLRMMASENMEEWGSSGWVEIETVRATIDAFDKGLIELPDVPIKTRDGYVRKTSSAHAYTKTTVAQFLGWMTKTKSGGVEPNFAIEVAFRTIDATGDGLVRMSELKALTLSQIDELVNGMSRIRKAEDQVARQNREDAERARKQAEAAPTPVERRRYEKQAVVHEEQAGVHQAAALSKAKDFGKEAADRFRGGSGLIEVRNRADELKPTIEQQREIPDVDGITVQVISKLNNFFNNDDDVSVKLALVREFNKDLSDEGRRKLLQAAERLRERLQRNVIDVFEID